MPKQTIARFPVPSLMQLADKASVGVAPPAMHFECPPQDMACIAAIVKRANEIGQQCAPPVQFDTMVACMDIAAVHCNCVPLKLQQLLMSDTSDFMNDFAGIGLHIDRATGQLRHGWRPLFARDPRP